MFVYAANQTFYILFYIEGTVADISLSLVENSSFQFFWCAENRVFYLESRDVVIGFLPGRDMLLPND